MNKKNSTKGQPGVNKLGDELESLRMDVVSMELRARYWKASYEMRHYMLETNKIDPIYQEQLAAQIEKNKKDMEEYQRKMKEEFGALVKHTVTQEDLDSNPSLAEEGIKVGDEIEIPNLSTELETEKA